jgi:CCR4-NOT transcription complex subunit 3
VYATTQQSLKEKYEGDLKKEIKKLQRLRDQIKTWISSNDVRDKSALTEARRVGSGPHAHCMHVCASYTEYIHTKDTLNSQRVLRFCMQTIELKMEQFKVCEKETKTKAFSKEGLARHDTLDPHEQEKQDKREWLEECIQKLNETVSASTIHDYPAPSLHTQIEGTEADIERLNTVKRKKKSDVDEV